MVIAAASAAALVLPPVRLATRRFRCSPPLMMPEGPEVAVHAETLDGAFAGAPLHAATLLSGRYAATPPENWDALQAALPATVRRVRSHGKFLWWEFDEEPLTLWTTLGMTGAWSLRRSAHARLELRLGAEPVPCYLNDQREFGRVTVSTDAAELEAKLASLGPSWIAADGGSGLPLDAFLEIARRQRKTARQRAVPLCRFLMNQARTAGIGNYVLSEALHRARVHPFAECGALDDDDWAALHEAIDATIAGSYRSQRAAAAAGAGGPSVTRGSFGDFELAVYRRDRTPTGALVQRDEGPHGRSVFWVPESQTRGAPEEG